jgi:hypothetical protein
MSEISEPSQGIHKNAEYKGENIDKCDIPRGEPLTAGDTGDNQPPSVAEGIVKAHRSPFEMPSNPYSRRQHKKELQQLGNPIDLPDFEPSSKEQLLPPRRESPDTTPSKILGMSITRSEPVDTKKDVHQEHQALSAEIGNKYPDRVDDIPKLHSQELQALGDVTSSILNRAEAGGPLENREVAMAFRLAEDQLDRLSHDLDRMRVQSEQAIAASEKLRTDMERIREEISTYREGEPDLDRFVGLIFRVFTITAVVAVFISVGPALLTIKGVWFSKVVDGVTGAFAGAGAAEAAVWASRRIPPFVDRAQPVPPPPLHQHKKSIRATIAARRDDTQNPLGPERNK